MYKRQVQLFKAKCLPALYYGSKACPVNRTVTKSLQYVCNELTILSRFHLIFILFHGIGPSLVESLNGIKTDSGRKRGPLSLFSLSVCQFVVFSSYELIVFDCRILLKFGYRSKV